ncbi:MAG: hypothetical protein QF862_06080, partial [Prochlorococcaceae cyanobacterium ETNP7_MAG_30]|nr:hypothetical protein [Prochlorococcaceae cyanobacterium ETNP7_MAG_30]
YGMRTDQSISRITKIHQAKAQAGGFQLTGPLMIGFTDFPAATCPARILGLKSHIGAFLGRAGLLLLGCDLGINLGPAEEGLEPLLNSLNKAGNPCTD